VGFCTPSFFGAILHLIFVFNCTFAPYLFANCAILHPLFFFLIDFAPHLLLISPSFNDDFEQNTVGKRWGAKSLKKKRGCKIARLTKDWGENAIKPKKIRVKYVLGPYKIKIFLV